MIDKKLLIKYAEKVYINEENTQEFFPDDQEYDHEYDVLEWEKVR
jgi:hypothetical protein